MTDSLNMALVLMRIALALMFSMHATQKLLGWFSGAGLAASAAVFEKLGQHPARLMVVVAATAELTSAALVGLGFATPVGVAIGAATMLVAGASLTRRSRTFWNATGGGEYPFFTAATLFVIAFSGPGAWSLDAGLEMPWHNSDKALTIGVGVVVVAIIASLVQIAIPYRDGLRRFGRAGSKIR